MMAFFKRATKAPKTVFDEQVASLGAQAQSAYDVSADLERASAALFDAVRELHWPTGPRWEQVNETCKSEWRHLTSVTVLAYKGLVAERDR